MNQEIDKQVDKELQKIENTKEITLDVILKNIDLLPSFSNSQIEKLLTALPYKMEKLERVVIACEAKYDEAVSSCKRIEALYKLKSIEKKQTKELLSEGDRSSWVQTQKEVIDAQQAVLIAKNELAEARVSFNRYERNFVAVRKIASMVNNVDVNMGIGQKYL